MWDWSRVPEINISKIRMHHAVRLNPSSIETPRARLLVVDDEQIIRELYGRVLRLDGYEVETAEDGVAGLEWLAKERFDLVVTDRHMPRLDGASMLLALRSAGSRIPVVMISASLAIQPLPAGIAKEVSAGLQKTAGCAELLAAVAAALLPTSPLLAQRRENVSSPRPMDLVAA
jgi:DNA-binding response OmpR family regulator